MLEFHNLVQGVRSNLTTIQKKPTFLQPTNHIPRLGSRFLVHKTSQILERYERYCDQLQAAMKQKSWPMLGDMSLLDGART